MGIKASKRSDRVSAGSGESGTRSHRVLLIAPAPPPYGGMALQAQQLEKLLRSDGNSVVFVRSNFSFPGWLRLLERIPGLRTLLRAALIWPVLWMHMRKVETVHVLAASWLYFFLVVCPAVITGRLSGRRVVLNYRGGEAREFFRRWGWAAAPLFRWSHVVTVPSDFLAQTIRSRFGVPVTIVPNILDGSTFRYRQRPVFQPKLLSARHLEKMYDIESVLKAFRVVQGHYPEASLWIAGTGSQQEYLRSLVATWNLRNVRFLGSVPQRELASVYDQCDIFINASRVDNFPGALLEASSAGLVIVSTNAGGIPFIYRHGKTALLVEPGDWQGLAQAVEQVLQSPTLAADLTTEAALAARACAWTEVRKPLYRAYGFPLLEDSHEQVGEYRCIAG